MFFLNPSFFWALLGLGVPLAIHIWSKKQEKHIKVGSIKYLQESDAQKSKSLKVNEIALLLLRMFLIALLVFILSEPRLKGEKDHPSLTYIVEASILDSPKLKQFVDSLTQTTEVRLLQHDFPVYTQDFVENHPKSDLDYWQLGKAMQSLNTDSIVVFTNAFLKNIKGKRPALQNHIHWVQLEAVQPTKTMIGVLKREAKDEVISVTNDSNSIRFLKEKQEINNKATDSLPSVDIDTISVKLVSEGKLNKEGRYLKTVISAIANYLDHPIDIKSVDRKTNLELKSTDLLVWLSPEPVPETKGKVLRFEEDVLASSLIVKGDDQEYVLTSYLNSETIVSERLGIELIDLLEPYSKIEKEAIANDYRIIDMNQLQPNIRESSTLNFNPNGKDISSYLWVGFFILIVSERLLSKYRKQ